MAKCLGELELPYDMLKPAFEDNMDNSQAFHECLHKPESPGKDGVIKFGLTFEDEPA